MQIHRQVWMLAASSDSESSSGSASDASAEGIDLLGTLPDDTAVNEATWFRQSKSCILPKRTKVMVGQFPGVGIRHSSRSLWPEAKVLLALRTTTCARSAWLVCREASMRPLQSTMAGLTDQPLV